MKNRRQRRPGFPHGDDYPTLFELITKPSKNRKWVSEFSEKADPCLKKLYSKYKIPPDEVIEAVTLCRFSPVPPTFPPILRNARRRERLAAQIEKLTDKVRELDWLSTPVWKLELVSNHNDYSLEWELERTAKRIRGQKSIPGRPEDRMLRECAHWLSELFQRHAKQNLYPHISDLLAVAFPDRWVAHGDGARAVKDLLKRRRKGAAGGMVANR